MKISTRLRYGLRLIISLALRYGNGPTLLKDIARAENISEKYLGQIIIPLKRSGLLSSVRGAHGGYMLNRDPGAITVKDVVEAIEGKLDLIEGRDGLSLAAGSSQKVSCLIWKKLEKSISDCLKATTLNDLVTMYKENNKDILMYNI